MRHPLGIVALVPLVAAGAGAQYNVIAAWPPKGGIQDLRIDSSAPGLLPSGSYTLDLQVNAQRLVGRLHQGRAAYEQIPFSHCRAMK